jgi:GTP-binding protein LepA
LAAIIEKFHLQLEIQKNLYKPLIFDSHYNPFRGIEVIFECKWANKKRAKN